MNDTPPRKTYWVQIGITIVCGVVLAVGSCFGALLGLTRHAYLAMICNIGFVAGILAVIVAMVWLVVEVIKSMFRK